MGKDGGKPKSAQASCRGPASICLTVEDWLQAECKSHSAMLVPRTASWCDFQKIVDRFAQSSSFRKVFDEIGERSEQIKVSTNHDQFKQLLVQTAKKLVKPL